MSTVESAVELTSTSEACSWASDWILGWSSLKERLFRSVDANAWSMTPVINSWCRSSPMNGCELNDVSSSSRRHSVYAHDTVGWLEDSLAWYSKSHFAKMSCSCNKEARAALMACLWRRTIRQESYKSHEITYPIWCRHTFQLDGLRKHRY